MQLHRALGFVIGCVLLLSCARTKNAELADAPNLILGKQIYMANCAACHGDAGDGKGIAAYLLFPKPRNFQRSEFKLRSTPEGVLPTDEDLMKTVSQGIPGTAMFAFSEVLSEAERRAVVSYVKVLAPRFKDAPTITPAQLLKIPVPPEVSPELIAEGKATYEKFGCGKCHGPEGRGDGPAAPTLTDTSGDPFPAAAFAGGIYKSGGQPVDLFRTLLAGMTSTPMPSFQQAFTSDREAWGLVYYTLSFTPGGKAMPITGDNRPLEVVTAGAAAALTDPDSAAWDNITPIRVYLRPLWYRNNYPIFVKVRAATAGGRIGILAEWDDPTNDSTIDNEQSFADGAAMQFALSGKMPFIAMGDRNGQGLCEIWHWRADRQLAADGGRAATRSDAYPHMFSDPGPNQPDYNTARDAGNVLTDSKTENHPAHSLNAAGPGTLTARAAAEHRVDSHGRWKSGVYRVAFSSALTPSDSTHEADFTKAKIPVAFAIWDGHNGDRNGTKLVSQWLFLQRRPQ